MPETCSWCMKLIIPYDFYYKREDIHSIYCEDCFKKYKRVRKKMD